MKKNKWSGELIEKTFLAGLTSREGSKAQQSSYFFSDFRKDVGNEAKATVKEIFPQSIEQQIGLLSPSSYSRTS